MNNNNPIIAATTNQIRTGLFENPGASTGPDTLAWGILALQVSGFATSDLTKLRIRLGNFQMNDGRFVVSPNAPETIWPTPIALFGLLHDPDFRETRTRAVEFLLNTQGVHWTKQPGDPAQNDPSIIGWPWMENTHSWIIPTALSIMALKLCGHNEHPRITEGIRMILDRQIATGGWNYGNTVVYRSALKPIPECTGFALHGLQGFTGEDTVAPSLSYLNDRLSSVRTPLSLAWGLLGLGAWSQRPTDAETWIAETLHKQERYGPYQLSLLSQLVISYHLKNGLYSLLP